MQGEITNARSADSALQSLQPLKCMEGLRPHALTCKFVRRAVCHVSSLASLVPASYQNTVGEECHLAIETSGHGAMRENHWLDDGAYLMVGGLPCFTAIGVRAGH